MIDRKVLGQKIKEARVNLHLTQSDLADLLHVSFQAISNWERGLSQIDLDNLSSLAKNLHVSLDYLLSESKDEETLFLAIDGGGTKTEFVVFNSEGNIKARLLFGQSNPNDIGIDQTISLLINGINQCLSKYPSIKYLFGGIAGLLTGNNLTVIKDKIKTVFPSLYIEFDGDIANVFHCNDDIDMALIMGTGSVLFIKDQEKRVKIGGWGYLLDQLGSGYDIGREAIRVVLDETESKQEYSLIPQLIIKDGIKPESLIQESYKNGRKYIAGFARYVFMAYQKQDEKAINIIKETANYIANLFKKAYSLFSIKHQVIASGGIIENYQKILVPLIKEQVDIDFYFPPISQIFGACKYCFSFAKIDNSNFDKNFIKSYKESIKHD